jgi:hypothetical protein
MPLPLVKRSALPSSRLVTLPFALATASLLLFQLGYSFEAGDQLQYLLLPYREIFPNFLPDDWFTWRTSHYHVSFAWLVRGVHALSGDPAGFARGMFAVHCLNLALFGVAIWRLARAVGVGLLEASFSVLAVGAIRQVGLAGALVNHAGLVPSDLALAPFLLACAAFCERRSLAMGAWLGVSGLLHANYAVLGPLVLFPLEFGRERSARAPAGFVRSVAAFSVLAAPSLVMLFGTFLARDTAPAAVAVTLFVRSPHHYDLMAMRADEFYFAALLLLISGPYWFSPAPKHEAYRAHRQLIAAMLVVLAIGALGSGFHIVALARLFAWRMSIPLFLLLLLAAGAALRRYALLRDWVGLCWFIAGCALLSTFAQRDPLEPSAWNAAPGLAAGTLLAFGAATAAQLFGPRRRALVMVSLLGDALAVGLALSVACIRPDGSGPPLGLHVLDARIEIEPRLRKLFSMVRERTPEGARFLIPPGQNQFRLHARRAVYVDWKCAPMKGDEALEWKRRMLLVMGTHDFPARGYELPRVADGLYYARPLQDLIALARAEGLTHLLLRRSQVTQPDPGLRKSFSAGEYVVLEL